MSEVEASQVDNDVKSDSEAIRAEGWSETTFRGAQIAPRSLQLGFYSVVPVVWGVQTRDTSFRSPWRIEGFRETQEYREPIKLSKPEVAKIAHKLLVDQLGLPEKLLFLDTDPVFHLVPNPKATKGVRRYYFSWQRPETAEELQQREEWGAKPELSVSAEVDAVSGEIKVLRFWHQSLEKPDPKIELQPEPTRRP